MPDSDVVLMENHAPPKAGGSPLDIFERLAAIEGADIEKLSKLLEMDRQWRADRAVEAFNAAKARVALRIKPVVKDAEGQHSRFARLETILKGIKPIYAEEGFSLSAAEGESTRDPEKYVRVILTVDHKDGCSRSVWMDVARDGLGAKGSNSAMNATQACGSTFTYGRRYLTVQFFDVTIAEEDDDGQDDRLIDAAEIADLETLIEEFKDAISPKPFRFAKFLETFGREGCERLSDFTVNQFEEARRDLRNQIAQAKKGAKS